MDTQVFWNVIGNYNTQTKLIQLFLVVFTVFSIIISYIKGSAWLAKLVLGIINLFIAFGFFAWYGTEPIQKYFAFPLYIFCGILFLYESWQNRNDVIQKPSKVQLLLLLLYLFYPLVSVLLGNTFPQMATHIMPCPVISLSIAVYACCQRKNKVLLALLTVWGLTGVKSLIFHAYEDIILLICGLYGIALLIKETDPFKKSR